MLATTAAHSGSGSGSRVGGKSGGVLNDELIKELREVALEHVRTPLYRLKVKAKVVSLPSHGFDTLFTVKCIIGPLIAASPKRSLSGLTLSQRGRISCLYADGVAFADSMKTLGLFGECRLRASSLLVHISRPPRRCCSTANGFDILSVYMNPRQVAASASHK